MDIFSESTQGQINNDEKITTVFNQVVYTDDDDSDDSDNNTGILQIICPIKSRKTKNREADAVKSRKNLDDFSKRLEGVCNLLEEKLVNAKRAINDIDDECAKLADKYLTSDPPSAIVEIDLASRVRVLEMKRRQYERYKNIKDNLDCLKCSVDVHELSVSIKDTFGLIPSKVKKIQAETELCMATIYSDQIDKLSERMALSINKTELEKCDSDETIKADVQRILKERLHSRKIASDGVSRQLSTVSVPKLRVDLKLPI